MGKPDSNSFPFLGGDPTSTFTKDWQLYIGGIPCAIYQAEGEAIKEHVPRQDAKLQCNSFASGINGSISWRHCSGQWITVVAR